MYKKKSPRGEKKVFGKEDSNSPMYVVPLLFFSFMSCWKILNKTQNLA